MDAMDVLNGCSLKRPTTALAQNLRACAPDLSVTKKLKRMPHLFTRVLELPFHADTPVRITESPGAYRFEARLPGLHVEDVKVEVMEIVLGATKVLVRGVDTSPELDVDEVNFWRFRLPPTTLPEKSAASYEHDILSVTIPKVLNSCNDNHDMQGKDDGDADMILHPELADDAKHSHGSTRSSCNEHAGSDIEAETEEERMQREVLEDLESFGSPRRQRASSPRLVAEKASESEADLEKMQREVLEELECFGSPRRRSASCTQSIHFASQQKEDLIKTSFGVS